jgi:hypothetical protein
MELTFVSSGTVITGRESALIDYYSVEGAPIITLFGRAHRLALVDITESGAVTGFFVRVTKKDGVPFKNGEGMNLSLRRSGEAVVLASGLTYDMADEIVNALEDSLPVPCDVCGAEEIHWHCFTCDDVLIDTVTGGRVHASGACIPPMRVVMQEADKYSQENYGVAFRSTFVYRAAGSSAPTRIAIWDNTRRPNTRNGEPVRYGEYGPRDGGNGRYLDPHHVATDAEQSVLITPECTVLSAHGSSTGTAASGQVWSGNLTTLRTGVRLALRLPDGSVRRVTVRLTNNGHGVAE